MHYSTIKSSIKRSVLIRVLGLSTLFLSLPSLSYAAQMDGIRGSRYCEIIIATAKLSFGIYSTVGINDCTDTAWQTITTSKIRHETGSFYVYLNGPRYLVTDGFENKEPAMLAPKPLGGLDMHEEGFGHVTLLDIVHGGAPYREHKVNYSTTWIYKSTHPVYQLVSPEGLVYVMHSYSTTKSPLTEASLANLGEQLNLPKGWRFRTGVLKKDAYLTAAQDKAVIIQDDLQNTYQLVTNDFVI